MNYWLLCLLVLLVACTTTPVDCKGVDDRDTCIVTLAVSQGDAELCSTLDKNKHVWCFTDVAKAAEDAELCNRIENAQSKEFCRRDIYIAQQDVEACFSLETGAKDDCFYEIATETEDWLTCLSMEASQRREDCVESISRAQSDPQGCLRLDADNNRRDGCLYMTSIETSNYNTCAEIADAELVRYCYIIIATNAEGVEDCEGIPDEFAGLCLDQFEA